MGKRLRSFLLFILGTIISAGLFQSLSATTMLCPDVSRKISVRHSFEALRSMQNGIRPHPLSQLPIEEVWEKYRDEPTEEIRNFLMLHFLPLVRMRAELIHAGLPEKVDIEDLMSAGNFGLLDAIDSYDLSRKVKFETFSSNRIRGAILDEIRNLDFVPKLVRIRSNKLDELVQKEKERGNLFAESDLYQILFDDLSAAGEPKARIPAEIEKILKDGFVSHMNSFSIVPDTKSGKTEREEDEKKTEARHSFVRFLLGSLTPVEREVITLTYFGNQSLRDIQKVVHLSISTLSVMHRDILKRLREKFESDQAYFLSPEQ